MKKLIPYLKSASTVAAYKVFVEFEDGVSGVVDLSKWKGKGVFEYWNDEENFKKFRITSSKKIEWNDEIDMDPDAFYLKLIGKTFEEYADDKQLLRHSY
jgi:hypothetical protein